MFQRPLRACGFVALLAVALASPHSPSRGADRELQAALPAEQLVAEALHREVYGLQQDRDRLLGAALLQDPDYAPARWHQGYVRYGDEWIRAEAIPELLGQDAPLAAYESERRRHADSLAGNTEMANWCRQRGLSEQERAHLSRVLDFVPDDAGVRARLGFRWSDGVWKTQEQMRREDEREEAQRVALSRWRGRIERMRSALRQADDEKRALAEARIREIDDPTAIAALESVLAADSQQTALLAVETIARMQGEDAVQALIRQAVLSRFGPVRTAAARALGQRPLEYYVPVMLAEMYRPVTSRIAVVPTGNGRFVYRHAFLREGQDQRQVLLLDTQYRRLARPGGDGNETLMRLLLDSFGTALARERSVAQQNLWAALMNQRLSSALNIATGQQLPASPTSWWQWWDEQQDVVLLGQKQTRQFQRTRQVALLDRVQPAGQSDGGIQVSGSPQGGRAECFAAGTPVWTASGLLAIEAVRVGDLVLSQDTRSGELAYKPVLRTTIRPAERLVKVQAGDDTFQISSGHLFWVAGDGWTRSRDLESGVQLHSLRGSVPVYEVDRGDTAETYNLIVADFHTYFVGDSQILSHDVTPRRPAEASVPGLIAQ